MTSDPSTDTIFLNDLREDGAEAWGRAFERLWKIGWMTAKGKLPYDSAEQIEDLVSQVITKEVVPQIIEPRQEAFVKAQTFEDVVNLTSRIISNRVIDEIRKRTRRPESSNIETVPEGEFATQADETKKGIAEEIQLALSNIDERYRVLLEDFYFGELSTEEISRKRGKPKGTVCSDLVKARSLMSSQLEGRLDINVIQ